MSFIDTYPTANDFVHWLVSDIPSSANLLVTDASGNAGSMYNASEQDNSDGGTGYVGPFPPTGEVHTYALTFYALSTPEIGGIPNATAALFYDAIEPYILAQDTFTGTYEGQ